MEKKVYNNVVVAILDGQVDAHGDILPPSTILPKEPVPVYFDFNTERFVGTASLRFDGVKIVAELHLDQSLPFHKTYPSVGGHILSREGKQITEFNVNMIGLSTSGNADFRIGTIEEQTA